jgi:hypothetical protein
MVNQWRRRALPIGWPSGLAVGKVRLDSYRPKSKGARFPVLMRDGKIEWSTVLSATGRNICAL